MITANQRRLKVGVLTPHAAVGPEIEIPDMSQGRVTVTVARIRAPENAAGTESTGAPTALRALTRPEAVDGDAACFGDGSVDVVAHASTTTGYVLGVRSEAELIERLATKCAVPVVGSAGAAADALRACGAHRLVLVHPPWFDDEIDRMGVGYFRDQGFDVTLLKATGLSRDPSRIHTEGITDWVSRHLVTVTRPCSWPGTAFEPLGPYQSWSNEQVGWFFRRTRCCSGRSLPPPTRR